MLFLSSQTELMASRDQSEESFWADPHFQPLRWGREPLPLGMSQADGDKKKKGAGHKQTNPAAQGLSNPEKREQLQVGRWGGVGVSFQGPWGPPASHHSIPERLPRRGFLLRKGLPKCWQDR